MGHPNNRYCEPDEFFDWEPYRLDPDTLQVDEFYILMTSISDEQGKAAAKKMARLIEVEAQENGSFLAHLAILNSDCSVEMEAIANFVDGYWEDIATGITLAGRRVDDGYLRPYRDFDVDEFELILDIELPKDISHSLPLPPNLDLN